MVTDRMIGHCPDCGAMPWEMCIAPGCGQKKDVPSPQTKDMVNSPSHYTAGKVEVIDYILQVTKDYPGNEAALVGNIIKYVSRAPHKGKKREDLEKARWYLNKLLEIT